MAAATRSADGGVGGSVWRPSFHAWHSATSAGSTVVGVVGTVVGGGTVVGATVEAAVVVVSATVVVDVLVARSWTP